MASPSDFGAMILAFNKLPRNRDSPSGAVPNHFCFSIRHVSLTPPGYLLYIIQPQSRYVHVEGPLPSSFEAESLQVKATTISVLLLKAFTSGLGAPEGMQGRPWSWVCDNAELAGAIGEMLRSLGVTAPEGVGIANNEETKIADEQWTAFLDKLGSLVQPS